MDARDDLYEYSLDNHHDEAAGKKIRKRFVMVLIFLSVITIIEVAMGMKWSRVEGMGTILMVSFISMTLIKAAGIVWEFMHMGHETSGFRKVVLWPYFILVGYFIFIVLVEAVHSGTLRPMVETFTGL